MRTFLPALGLLVLLANTARADENLVGKPAPSWGVEEPGAYRGRVVYLLAFDAERSPGGYPALLQLATKYRPLASDVQLIGIALPSTRWRDREAETKRLSERLGIPIALGPSPALEKGWGKRKAPWAAVIDRLGVVRYAGPAPDATRAAMMIDAVRLAGRQPSPLVGKPLGSIAGLRLVDAPRGFSFADHDVTLVRWWTLACPFCMTSLPHLSALHQRRQADGLAFLPVYHHKGGPRRRLTDLRQFLDQHGYRSGPYATDPRWQKLQPLMRQAGFKSATSVSFLVDRKGIVRWVHPGPRILYSAKPEDASADADMRGLEAAVGLVLEEARQARAAKAAKQAQAAPPAFPAPK